MDDDDKPRPVDCFDIMTYRDRLKRDQDLWAIVVAHWRNRSPLDSEAATAYTNIVFRGSITMERAEMEVSVNMVDEIKVVCMVWTNVK